MSKNTSSFIIQEVVLNGKVIKHGGNCLRVGRDRKGNLGEAIVATTDRIFEPGEIIYSVRRATVVPPVNLKTVEQFKKDCLSYNLNNF